MISKKTLARYERDVARVLDRPKEFPARIWDTARVIKSLCDEVRRLQHDLAKAIEMIPEFPNQK